jgi:L-fuconolactonase
VGERARDVPGQMEINPEWLGLAYEPALEPDLTIIDAHHHIWDPPGARYLFDDYLSDTRSGHRIAASVFIECHSMYRADGPEALKPIGETEFIAGVAAQSASGRYGETQICAGIVAHIDFSLGARFDEVIEAHMGVSGGRLCGFRGRVSSHPDPEINKWQTPAGILLEPASIEAMAVLANYGMPLDVWAYQVQHDDLCKTCERLPQLQVILDHAAGPLGCGPFRGRRAEMLPDWLDGIRRLASYPNTVIKFSGMGMRFAGFDYHRQELPPSSGQLADDWRPYFDACLETFGPDRIMFASNFPADKGSFGFGTAWNAFKRLSQGCSPQEKRALFSGTAARIYDLSVQP